MLLLLSVNLDHSGLILAVNEHCKVHQGWDSNFKDKNAFKIYSTINIYILINQVRL